MSSQITRDEIIALCLAAKYLLVDFDNGEVYATRGPGGTPLSAPKLLKGSNCNGYRVISVHFGGVKKQCRLHRIIWIAAHGMIPQGMVVDHINCNKQDNRLSNLQLLTPADNSHKALLDGLYLTGENSPTSKINYAIATQIRADYQTGQYVMRELADKYGISKSRVQQIVRFQGWTEEESDAARYKALGNSVALPCVDYVISGVVDVLDPID